MRTREREILVHSWWTDAATMENCMAGSQKTKNRTTTCPSNSAPGYIFKQNTNSTKEWIKMWCKYNEKLLSGKKEWKFAISNMDDAKWNKSEKGKYYISLICGI